MRLNLLVTNYTNVTNWFLSIRAIRVIRGKILFCE